MSRIEMAEKKWAAKTTAAIKRWAESVKSPESFEAFVKGVASFTGLSESAVRALLPTKNWQEFQNNVDDYIPIFTESIKKAVETKKWSKGYLRAFSTPA